MTGERRESRRRADRRSEMTNAFGIRTAKKIVHTIQEWVAAHPTTALETITLVAHSEADLAVLQSAIGQGES